MKILLICLYILVGAASAAHAHYDWYIRTCEHRSVLAAILGYPFVTATWPFYWYDQVARSSMNTWRCGDPR